MKIKPLPCPFCGKQPAVHPKDPEREGNAWGAVQCEMRSCPTFDNTDGHGARVNDGSKIADERGTEKYQEAAIRRWNRRP